MSGLHRIDSHHHHQADQHEHRHDHDGLGSHRHLSHLSPSVALAPAARSRRAFLGQLGKGTMAMAVFSPAVLAACASDGNPVATATSESDPTAESGASSESDPTAEPDPTVETPPEADSTADPVENATGDSDLVWARSNLGFVSAYVLARGNSAAIVDTGVAGSAAAIGATLAELGLNYSNVEHVLLTHHHGDHTGSIGEVLEMAINATAYAGEADVPSISAEVTGLAGGEDIFGFEMVPTPGHTLGHMAAIDHQAGLFIAGDAIFTENGEAIEGPERFFMSVAESRRSIAAVAALSFNTLLVGHGDPIEGGADAAVAALAASFS